MQDTATVWLHVDALTPWDRNPRRNADAIPKVAASLRHWGFVAPVVVWREGGRMVAGHTRVAALRSILAADPTFVPKGAPTGAGPGMLPVRFHTFANEGEADAYGIADNRLNEIATWDAEGVAAILDGLTAPLVELSGFTIEMPELPPLSRAGPLVPEGTSDDTFKLKTLTGDRTVTEHVVRFGAYRFSMSEAEATLLTAACEEFKSRTGTYDGFIGHLVSRV
jgi:hypothetical protein